MATHDGMGEERLLEIVDRLYACVDAPENWEAALGAVGEALGGDCALIETIDLATGEHRIVHSWRLPPAHEVRYLVEYAALSPRLPFGRRQPLGALGYDYQILDETAMARDPFYAEFLPQLGIRYFASGVLHQDERRFSAFSVQRAKRRGHVETRELKLLDALIPHIRQAFDLSLRLEQAAGQALADTLDHLGDAVLLVGDGGRVLVANASARRLLEAGDGVRLSGGRLVFRCTRARRQYDAALAAILRLRAGRAPARWRGDFPARPAGRASGLAVAVRTLPARAGSDAVAAVFVRDVGSRSADATSALAAQFDLTPAEAALAEALRRGDTVGRHAAARGVSANTAYTHLRRIKEKTGTSRQTELASLLNRAVLALRTTL